MVIGQESSYDYKMAEVLFSHGKYQDAIRMYETALNSPSNSITTGVLYTRIADSYFWLNDYERAREAYRNALNNQKPGERAQTHYWIGLCSLLLGRDTEAVAEFLKIPDNYPESGMWVVTAYYWAGRASERAGRKEDAAEFYRKAGGKGQSIQEQYAMKKAKNLKKGDK